MGVLILRRLPALALLLLSSSFGSELDQQIQRIFGSKDYAVETFGPARWMRGGAAYTTVEDGSLIQYETSTGKRQILVDKDRLNDVKIEDYSWSSDEKKLLVYTASKKVWRQNTLGEYWVLDLAGKSFKKVGSDLMFAKFSPDGTRVAYVHAHDIYVQDLATGKSHALTSGGSETLINGTSDWVYEEELGVRDAFRWSPDGRSIAYWQFDSTGVQQFALINNTSSIYPKLTYIPYPKAGTTNSAVRIGVVSADGDNTASTTTWMKIPGDPREHYIFQIGWKNDRVVIGQLNRLQNTAIVFQADPKTGEAKEIFRDQDKAWVDVREEKFQWIGDDPVWLSERDGWRQIYAGSRRIGTGPGDVISLLSIDPDMKWAYYLASPDNATQQYLYRVSLKEGGPPERLTPANEAGTHSYNISPDCQDAFHTYSRFDAPPITDLVKLPGHTRVRMLKDNAKLRAEVAPLLDPPVEFLKVPVGNGVVLDGWLLKPRNFDASKKYPLIVYVYGEPASANARDSWGGARELFHRALANEGYLVASFDNRGTPAPKGREWRKAVYGSVGVISAAEQGAAVQELARERSYVDASRVAVWGWSGGGSNTLNCMFRDADVFKVGVAVAPVPDQKLYDTIYQERYMGLPQGNAEGYRLGSPVNFAEGLKGKLLIIHGSGDDNVHYQGTEEMINRLVELGKPFDFMEYPNRTHSISEGKGTSVHVFSLIARYLEEHL
jgi:dipeptidyl-peptidase-4